MSCLLQQFPDFTSPRAIVSPTFLANNPSKHSFCLFASILVTHCANFKWPSDSKILSQALRCFPEALRQFWFGIGILLWQGQRCAEKLPESLHRLHATPLSRCKDDNFPRHVCVCVCPPQGEESVGDILSASSGHLLLCCILLIFPVDSSLYSNFSVQSGWRKYLHKIRSLLWLSLRLGPKIERELSVI